jgi:hypothetical protein
MVGASDINSSSAYSTLSLSSSEDEGDRRKGRKSSKNLSGLSCFTRDGFCAMALLGVREIGKVPQTQEYKNTKIQERLSPKCNSRKRRQRISQRLLLPQKL